MTKKKETPLPISDITLRDYFAAKALGSLLNVLAIKNLEVTPENIAALAYKRADAMLEERSK
jgi:hypothetical protein